MYSLQTKLLTSLNLFEIQRLTNEHKEQFISLFVSSNSFYEELQVLHCIWNDDKHINISAWVKGYLIKGWVQSKNFSVAVGLALLFVVPVNLLIGGTVEKVREQGIGKGVLQVKDAAGPAAAWGVIY